MKHYYYAVRGGEFTIESDHHWRIKFNGVQVGGVYDSVGDAMNAIEARRSGRVVGANLTGIADPPGDLGLWQHT